MVMIWGSQLLTRARALAAMARLSSREESTAMQVRSRLRGTLRSMVTQGSALPGFLLSCRFSVW